MKYHRRHVECFTIRLSKLKQYKSRQNTVTKQTSHQKMQSRARKKSANKGDNNWSCLYDQHGDGSRINFPIKMRTFLTLSPKTYHRVNDVIVQVPSAYTEKNSIKFIKITVSCSYWSQTNEIQLYNDYFDNTVANNVEIVRYLSLFDAKICLHGAVNLKDLIDNLYFGCSIHFDS